MKNINLFQTLLRGGGLSLILIALYHCFLTSLAVVDIEVTTDNRTIFKIYYSDSTRSWSEDQMAEVLTEVYLINAARSFDNRTILEQKIKLDSFFFKKFNIDSLQFVESNAYYTSNLSAYNKLFKKVEERMALMKVETDSLLLEFVQELEAKRVRDSIIESEKGMKKFDKKDSLVVILL